MAPVVCRKDDAELIASAPVILEQRDELLAALEAGTANKIPIQASVTSKTKIHAASSPRPRDAPAGRNS